MRIALGVHVSTYEVTASLVDTAFPELGPIASRSVAVAAAPGGIGGAVSIALGFMRVQAMQHDLTVVGSVVVCENALQREIVADGLEDSETDPPPVIDIFDHRMSDAFTPDIGAAMLVGELEPKAASTGRVSDRHRGMWPVAAVGACVLAALGGVTAWAMTSQPSTASEAPPSQMVYPTAGAASATTTAGAIPVGAVATTTPAAPDAPGPEIVPGAAVQEAPGVVAIVPAPEVLPEPDPAAGSNGGDAVQPTPTTTSRTTSPSAPGGGGGGGVEPTTTNPSDTETTTTAPTTTTTTTTIESEAPAGGSEGDNGNQGDSGNTGDE